MSFQNIRYYYTTLFYMSRGFFALEMTVKILDEISHRHNNRDSLS